MVDLSIMLKRSLILFFPCLLLTGCGIKGPLYLPPNPNDSYLSRIGQQINEMTGEDTVGAAPADVAQKAQDEALPAEGTDKNPGDATEQLQNNRYMPYDFIKGEGMVKLNTAQGAFSGLSNL